jgi:hypothetical protein
MIYGIDQDLTGLGFYRIYKIVHDLRDLKRGDDYVNPAIFV